MTTKPKAKKYRINVAPRNAPQPNQAAGQSAQAADAHARGQDPAARHPQNAPSPAPGSPAPAQTAPDAAKAQAQTQAPSTTPAGAAPSAQSNAAAPQATPKTRVHTVQTRQPATKPKATAPSTNAQPTTKDDLESAKAEGLSARQLRMARRVAQKNGITASSDMDAVRQLRARGINPFSQSNILDLVAPTSAAATKAAVDNPQSASKIPAGHPPDMMDNVPGKGRQAGRIQLPQTLPQGGETLPSTVTSPAAQREREISEIQRDLARRRRLKIGLLITRLTFFVVLPTILAGWYYYNMATPMYSSKSQFQIVTNETSGGAGAGPLSGVLPASIANIPDSIAVQSYLESIDAMIRLDQDVGFKDHFSDPSVDPIQRLAADASQEEAYSVYSKVIQIGFDPTEGIVRMETVAANPEIAEQFGRRLIDYAEERVNALSQRQREDQVGDAMRAFNDAMEDRREAQRALVELQMTQRAIDPEAIIAGLRGQINNTETLLLEKRLELAALLDNSRPNQARVAGVRSDIRRLEIQLAQLNERMLSSQEGENSLAERTVAIQMAQADLATRDLMLQSSLQILEQARMEATRQVRYLVVPVQPVVAQDPSYPRAFENTILAFLIFAGIYLVISLTASILREQLST